MPRTVLIVDDERDTNDILASFVRSRGFEPIQLFTGAEVRAAVAEHEPALILLDVMLPDYDGFAICNALKRDRETKTRTEIEIRLADGPETADDARRMLVSLGYRPVAVMPRLK